ncbi:hypothetical protein FACS1894170_07190 [Planctomycetales bacterium]|nr:hypothetical protein FACS1894170_07190 [Planctomycetales bacterium]
MEKKPFTNVVIEDLIRNAALRSELEPYMDESIFRVHFHHRSVRFENDFLAGMLDWELSPTEPVARWFEPELQIAPPETLSDDQLTAALEYVVQKLFDKKFVLDFTNHLSDRELYTLIYRDILPLRVKRLQHQRCYIHWDCTYGDDDLWLRYYASDNDRNEYRLCSGKVPVPKEIPPYYRDLPMPLMM